MFARILVSVTLAMMLIPLALSATAQDKPDATRGSQGYAGSRSCMECHKKFYDLWSTSRHGLAMQPYNAEFAKVSLTPQAGDVVIGKLRYRADLTRGVVTETGPKGTKHYKIEQALGGKNVYYFLTPFPKGRLQTLPLAYDVKKKVWFDAAASGVRHLPGRTQEGQSVNWKDPGYTFNTSCYNCHVSQLSTNYSLKTDTYKTTWAEPGINCETCHGPSAEHNRVMKEAPRGQQPKDMKIISVKKFTPEQHNATCSGCHAKMSPVTKAYTPGDRFFDHYGIATLEDPDFYPDGRDLGENYTYTSWLMSPCAKAGKINCVTCHTSSGRYRFKAPEKTNDACMPCHEKQLKNAPAHTRHKPDGPANACISCHMPMTNFARMNRTDHSMLPPAPSATIAYRSPNACNICHTDKDAAWADKHVRQWRTRDYQAPLLKRAALIDSARKRDWKQLPAMLDYITGKGRDEVFAASLIRMLPSSGDMQIAPVLIKAMDDPSPLVRAAAAEALQHVPTRSAALALVKASGDEYRLVRVRAAASLAVYPNLPLTEADRKSVEAANREYLASLTARPDQWSSHYNLGNYYLNRNDPKQAISSYHTALKLEPRAVPPMVNESMAYARMGDNRKAEESLNKALKTAPGSAAVNFNMGLLKAEQNNPKAAEQYLKKALRADPQMAQAAYNLCIITAKDRIGEAVTWCREAVELRPQEPRYVYTLAFYLDRKGDRDEAARMLKAVIEKYPGYKDAVMLLDEISKKRKGP